MAKEKVEVLIEGGKASAGPPIGPALGPLGVNVGLVVKTINEKTAEFKGMQVPVIITVDTDTKEFEIKIGTPPASALIKKELGIQTAAHNPKTEVAGNLSIEQLIKVTKMKWDDLTGMSLKERMKEMAGTCVSMGIDIDNKRPKQFINDLNKGAYDSNL